MPEPTWWLRPGEKLYEREVGTGTLKIAFVEDDRHSKWRLTVSLVHRGEVEQCAVIFNYRELDLTFDGDNVLLFREHKSLIQDLLCRAVGVQIRHGSLHQDVVDALARSIVRDGTWMAGQLLRHQLKISASYPQPMVKTALADLVPKHVIQRHASPLNALDEFKLTLAGILESEIRKDVMDALERIIRALGSLYYRALENRKVLHQYTWRELRDETVQLQMAPPLRDEDFALVRAVIDVAGLKNGGSSVSDDFTFYPPGDIEELSECNGYHDFMAYLQRSRDRPSPTAPMRDDPTAKSMPPPEALDPIARKSRSPANGTSTVPWRPTPWAFVSSVKEGIQEYRQMATLGCLRAQVLPIGMETWAAASVSTVEACRRWVQQCDVLVLILAHRYGSIAQGSGLSFTEIEYLAARELDKPILAFEVKNFPSGIPTSAIDTADLARFQEFKKNLDPYLRVEVENAGQLEGQVWHALSEWQKSRLGSPAS